MQCEIIVPWIENGTFKAVLDMGFDNLVTFDHIGQFYLEQLLASL